MLAKFWRLYQEIFAKATEKAGDDRSAAKGSQGHQKTPAFIHALCTQALSGNPEAAIRPKGGLTDVGRK
jgi:hypothetical protein